MAKIFLVEGAHWSVPGNIVKMCATQGIAQREALALVNLMRTELELPAEANPSRYEEALEEVKEYRNESDFQPYVDISVYDVIDA